MQFLFSRKTLKEVHAVCLYPWRFHRISADNDLHISETELLACHHAMLAYGLHTETPEECLEMLFLAPEERGKGTGKKLMQYGIEKYGIQEVTVNEQNPQAVGFYEHLGFQTYKRTECDEEGNPYPLLYMKRNIC